MSDRTIRLDLAYDGTGFRGWARQRDPSIRTVQGELERVLERVLRAPHRLSVAGRTDAGVHARGQVASFSTASRVTPERLRKAINAALAPEVVVGAAAYAPAGFDARSSASARAYGYVIDTREVPDPFTARFRWHRPGELSLRRMRAGAAPLVGEHDFSSFCLHPGAGHATVRNLQRLTIARDGELVSFSLRANAFLHQMARTVVGTLVAVGEGRIEPEAMRDILAARDRGKAWHAAPARGLALERVVYGRRTHP